MRRTKHFYGSFNEPLTIHVDITLGNNPFLLKSHYNTLEKEPLLVPASAAAAEEDEEDEEGASSE